MRNVLRLVLSMLLYPAAVSPALGDESPLRVASRAEGVQVRLLELPADLTACVRAGVEVRVRYELAFCVQGVGFLGSCAPEVREIRILRFDPISERYQIRNDVIGDQQDPIITMATSPEEALRKVRISRSHLVPKSFLAMDGNFPSSNPFVKVRAIAICKGERTTLTQMLNVLSLGIFGLPTLDTGWERFRLNGIN